jgi:predicted dienelactone hydrolase
MSVLFDHPADMKRLIDYMIGAWPDRAKLDAGKIGFFGFSRGGYTGLALLGGVPDLRKASFLCSDGSTHPACNELRRQEIPAESPPHEVRIRAAVLMDPAFGGLFDRDGLKAVSTPIQLWASERGGDGITPELVAAINEELPSKPDYHIVQEPDILPSWPLARWSRWRARRKYAETPTALIALLFTSASMPRCWNSFKSN